MARTALLEIANFICRFGDQRVLADYFDEIIVPAMTSGNERVTRSATYFFLDVSDSLLDSNDPKSRAIVGRFVKSAELHREQVFDQKTNKLLSDPKTMDTAPSSIFALLHASHRMLFVKEQADSPAMAQFGHTAQKLIRSTHINFINGEYARLSAESGAARVTKKGLLQQIPIPDVEVVPIFSGESLQSFVDRYRELRVMRISLAETNNEIDNAGFLRQLREAKENANSRNTSIEHRNSKGLDKSAVVEQLAPATQGNAIIKLNGVDKNGDMLSGNNSNFNVRVPVNGLGKAPLAAARKLFAVFQKLVTQHVLTTGQPGRDQAADN